jgi:hypothetical protein
MGRWITPIALRDDNPDTSGSNCRLLVSCVAQHYSQFHPYFRLFSSWRFLHRQPECARGVAEHYRQARVHRGCDGDPYRNCSPRCNENPDPTYACLRKELLRSCVLTAAFLFSLCNLLFTPRPPRGTMPFLWGYRRRTKSLCRPLGAPGAGPLAPSCSRYSVPCGSTTPSLPCSGGTRGPWGYYWPAPCCRW